MTQIRVDIPVLVGTAEEIALGERERWRCWGLIFCRGIERTHSDEWMKYVELVRRRARAVLATEAQASYWIERSWRWRVFGFVTRDQYQRCSWSAGPEGSVDVRLTIPENLAGLWAAAAWAEGHQDLAEWIHGNCNGWISSLALVTEGPTAGGEGIRKEVVEALRALGERAEKLGLQSLGQLANATALAVASGVETEVSAQTLRIGSEKALGFMEAHVREGETPGEWVIRGT
ncbi:MAG TPA: hypothetical protein VLQ45_28150 [Thermoanaerobaculia bacterium]|nr:hypothetical protein [Thermoanaerobaculia bacterium]